MTPEQFEDVIAHGNAMQIAEAVATLDEAERRKLAKTATQLYAEIGRSHEMFGRPDAKTPILDRCKKRLGKRFRPNRGAAGVAVLAVCSLSDARKVSVESDDPDVAAYLKVLCDRRPDWLDSWVKAQLEKNLDGLSWELLWPLIKRGVCRKPDYDAYIRAMAHELASWWQPEKAVPLSERLLQEPELLEDVWRLFEMEIEVFGDMWEGGSDAPPEHESWTAALVKLSEQGHLDRQRLLDVSLRGLTRGFKNHVMSGYIGFFERLRSTLEELAVRQQEFVGLLANPASHIVTFAMERLNELEKGGRLDDEAFLSGMTPIFQVRSKGQAKTALAVTGRILRRRPELVPQAVAGILEALGHGAQEVQLKALELLEAYQARLHPDHAASLRERLEGLAASLRPRAEQLVAQTGKASPRPAERSSPSDDAEASLVELTQRAERLAAPWRLRAGVDRAIEALATRGWPAPLEFDLLEIPVLTGVEPLVPIQDMDELLDRVAHAVEILDSADELELILDGISRLCDQRPADFSRRTAPLIKRICGDLPREAEKGLANGVCVPYSLSKLLSIWWGGCAPSMRYLPSHLPGVLRFWNARMDELIERVKDRLAAPMLAAPTHRGGWIDPIVFVDRLRVLVRQGVEPPLLDLIQGLLRLAPDHRGEALAAAEDLPGHVGRAVRWALGHAAGPGEADAGQSCLWLAAGRARNPHGTLTELIALGIATDIPDAVTPATYRWGRRRGSYLQDGVIVLDDLGPVELSEETPVRAEDCLPTRPMVVLHERRGLAFAIHAHAPWEHQWVGQIWPLNPDPFLVVGIFPLMHRLDMAASTLAPNHVYLEPLLAPDCPWSEMAYLALWIGLVSKDSDSRSMALDVLICAVGDGRAHPERMADVLLRLMAGQWLKLNRVADSLNEVARVSPLHAWFVAETLQRFVAGLEELPRDAHYVLAVLRELLVELGASVAPATRRCLEQIHGSGKAAKAAMAMLKLQPPLEAPTLQQALLQLLEARIARAERWAAGDGCDLANKT